MTDISQWFDEQIDSRPITALVFFRGNWCPFCEGYMKELNSDFLKDLRAVGGELFGVTAQTETGANAAQKDWALDYKVVSDPSLGLAKRYDIAITPQAQSPHPEGYSGDMSQPGVVIVNQFGKVLVKWTIDPSEANGFGALDRPLPTVLWAALQSALEDNDAVSLEGPRLDPAWLKDKYPDAYRVFEDYMAAQAS